VSVLLFRKAPWDSNDGASIQDFSEQSRMKLSDKQIQKFIDICEEEYGTKVSWEEGSEAAQRLCRLALLLYRPNANDEITNVEKTKSAEVHQ